jgi:hypothetical protein
LNGDGKFDALTDLNNWKWINSSIYNAAVVINSTDNYLQFDKKEGDSLNIEDGMFYFFGEARPEHVHVKMLNQFQDKESGDIRLVDIDANHYSSTLEYSKKPNSVSLFFRFGFYYFMRINQDDLSSRFVPNEWYTLDFIIDWNKKAITMYVDGVYSTTVVSNFKLIDTNLNSLVILNRIFTMMIKTSLIQMQSCSIT